MKYISILKISFLTTVVILLSCTHNNGDIGPLFGQWKLITIQINGNNDPNYTDNIFFAFQNDVTNMKIVRANHETVEAYGRWKKDGNTLLLIYDEPNYHPLSETYFIRGVNTCKIITLDSKELTLKMEREDNTYIYKFKKW